MEPLRVITANLFSVIKFVKQSITFEVANGCRTMEPYQPVGFLLKLPLKSKLFGNRRFKIFDPPRFTVTTTMTRYVWISRVRYGEFPFLNNIQNTNKLFINSPNQSQFNATGEIKEQSVLAGKMFFDLYALFRSWCSFFVLKKKKTSNNQPTPSCNHSVCQLRTNIGHYGN